jgi:uncharacterized membrane protein
MNGAHLHLITNHLPIVGIIIGTLVLIVGLLLKKDQIKQTGLGINVFSAITSIFAFLSGEKAEDVVEEIKGISETLIHTHEEVAELFFTLSLILGALSLITLYLSVKANKYAKFGYFIVLALSLALIVIGKQVGTSGGEIRHTEIRAENTVISEED